jgi:dethiobiotin synthetase
MAAEVLGRPPFTIADLVAELHAPGRAVVFVEGAGGARSPLAADGDTVTLAGAISPGVVVVVADAGLGTINLVLLTVGALGAHPTVVFLNRFDEGTELHRRNRDWLLARAGLEVVTDPEALAQLIVDRATR